MVKQNRFNYPVTKLREAIDNKKLGKLILGTVRVRWSRTQEYYDNDDCCGYLTVELKDQSPAPYWVLELGPIVDDLYDYSIVSDNNAISLFVLTRDVDRFYKLYQGIVDESLKEFGFTKPYNKPEIMNQTNCVINNYY